MSDSTERTLGALMRAHSHPEGEGSGRSAFAIAISRQAGAQGTGVARLVGERLGWPVYDRELLQHIAEKTGWRVKLLEDVDEKRVGWFQEAIESFLAVPRVHQTAYLRHMTNALASLAARGSCVLVGRAAAQALPPETTLRVRLVGDLADRVANIQKQKNLSADEAARWVARTDQERQAFVRDHFHKDVSDPLAHDLTLNTSRLSLNDCADLIVEALRRMQARASARPAPAAEHPGQ
jgi:cytidylate kinase